MSLCLTGAGAGSAAAGGSFTMAFLQAASTISFSTNTANFTSQNFGTADATRLIAVAIVSIGTNTVSSVTIGGVTATQCTGAAFGNTTMHTDIWFAAVPTTTSGTISVTLSGAPTRITVFAYSIISPTAAFSTGGGQQQATAKTVTATSLVVPSGGGTIAVAMMSSSGTPTAAAGMNVTDGSSNTLWGSHWIYAGHDVTNTGTQTFTITFTASTNQVVSGSFATFTP
jgi:hypothetical protein